MTPRLPDFATRSVREFVPQARAHTVWAATDPVCNQLKHAGIQVEDTPTGPRWTVGEQH